MADDLPHKSGMRAFDPHKTRLFHSPGPQAQAQAQAASSRRPRKGPPPLPGARPDWHDKTRVLPIERLLPSLKPLHATRRDTAVRRRPTHAVPRLSKQRVYAWAVCLVLWVSVAAASGMPSQLPQSAQVDAITIRTRVPASERPAAAPRPHAQAPASATNLPLQPSAAGPTAAPTPERPATRISARAALEALAAGDSLTASHLYGALAEQHPDNLAYARAARILSQRVQTEARNRGARP